MPRMRSTVAIGTPLCCVRKIVSNGKHMSMPLSSTTTPSASSQNCGGKAASSSRARASGRTGMRRVEVLMESS